jgi:hypothetical protein
MNSPALQEKITSEDARCHRLGSSESKPEEIIEELYLAAFSRLPTAQELQGLVAEFAKPDTNRKSLTQDLLWSLLNSPEFSYKD